MNPVRTACSATSGRQGGIGGQASRRGRVDLDPSPRGRRTTDARPEQGTARRMQLPGRPAGQRRSPLARAEPLARDSLTRKDRMIHPDLGSQHSSGRFQRPRADHGVSRGMIRFGNFWDNAANRSFFSTLKPGGQLARSIAPWTRCRPTCLTTTSGSTTHVGVTRPSGAPALWSSSGKQRQLETRVRQTSRSLMPTSAFIFSQRIENSS